MKTPQSVVQMAGVLAAASLLIAPQDSPAMTLNTTVASIYQVGTGAGVNLGHAVSASTNYNRLYAGGSYTAVCASALMTPATGQRYFSSENIIGGISLTVTIPESFPTVVNMPGFYSLTRGTTVNCSYNWTSRAIESGYTVGVGGVSFQTGNGERNDGSSQPFVMKVPGQGDGGDRVGCIP